MEIWKPHHVQTVPALRWLFVCANNLGARSCRLSYPVIARRGHSVPGSFATLAGIRRAWSHTTRPKKSRIAVAVAHDGGVAQRPARFNARVVGKGACRDDKPHTPSLTGDGAS
jgi:hypothetical protein